MTLEALIAMMTAGLTHSDFDGPSRAVRSCVAILFALAGVLFISACQTTSPPGTEHGLSTAQAPDTQWRERVLHDAGPNRAEILRALNEVPPDQAAEMTFLVRYMPVRDLTTLKGAYLLENVRLSHEARAQTRWGPSIPDDIYLNNVLPYASVSEAREDWRPDFAARFAGLVRDTSTPGQAADLLNRAIFNQLKVHYKVGGTRADQAPSDSIAQGRATCTGLSILLVDACRAAGVPARLAGVYEWTGKPGNHTWVEVWDGEWKFVGADEPDKQGFNHAWFVGDAARADGTAREHAVWAASWEPTGETMPLAFAQDITDVPGVNVTSRYAHPQAAAATPARLFVRVLGPDGKRLAASVQVAQIGTPGKEWSGESRDETRDLNDLLEFAVPRGSTLHVRAPALGLTQDVTVEHDTETITLAPPHADSPAGLAARLTDWFNADEAARATIDLSDADAWVAAHPDEARQLFWQAFKGASSQGEPHKDLDASRVRAGKYQSPFVVREVGAKPKGGWPLFIAMHGGGNAPKELNDSQWVIMQHHYKDHPELGGYLYLALRAPTDEWNGFYTDYVYPLIDRLIQSFLLWRDVNPDRVYIMGYSHGGYGAFAIGPKMPDRFAAIHASAGAPTDGETSAKTLYSTRMTYMVGEHDIMYGRLERDRKFNDLITRLRGDDKDTYPVELLYMPGFEHSNLPDHDMIPKMYPFVRNPTPRSVRWEQTDSVIKDFFWLEDDHAAKKREIDADIRNNTVTIATTGGVGDITLHLDARLVDLARPVTIIRDGVTTLATPKPSARALAQSIARRGDPVLATAVAINVPATPAPAPPRP